MVKVENLMELEDLLGISLAPYYPEKMGEHSGLDVSAFGAILASKIKAGELDAIRDAVLLISADPHLPFGKLVKSDLARALKQSATIIPLSDHRTLIDRTTSILSLEFCPREAEDYCKLIRKLGDAAIKYVVSNARPRCDKSILLVSRLVENAV